MVIKTTSKEKKYFTSIAVPLLNEYLVTHIVIIVLFLTF